MKAKTTAAQKPGITQEEWKQEKERLDKEKREKKARQREDKKREEEKKKRQAEFVYKYEFYVHQVLEKV